MYTVASTKRSLDKKKQIAKFFYKKRIFFNVLPDYLKKKLTNQLYLAENATLRVRLVI
jgi:hypothetical protein|tara:strand:- start:6867 stop:7040 length:174 start_codon:yes stop_codon:yes gene_type:complete